MSKGLRIIQGVQPGNLVREALTEILDSRELLCLATSTPTAGPHASTVFFAHDSFVLWFVSERTTEHGRNLATNPRASATVFLDPPEYAEGLQ
jgi:general stress protein 26